MHLIPNARKIDILIQKFKWEEHTNWWLYKPTFFHKKEK
jgi:hypothetical protein